MTPLATPLAHRLVLPAFLPLILLLAACDAAPPDALTDDDASETAAAAETKPMVAAAPAPVAVRAAGAVPAQIVDGQGFGQGAVVAATLQIPAGWGTMGGVNWNLQTPCVGNQMRLEWMAAAPDRRQEFELMHGFAWQVQGHAIEMNPCPVAAIRSTREFLQAVVQQRRAGARFVDYRDRADWAQKAAAAAPAGNNQAQVKYDSGQLLISYDTPAGPAHELFAATVTFTQVGNSVMGSTAMVVVQRALGGRPDEALGERIAASMKADPQWMAAVRERGMASQQRFASNQRQQIDQWHAREMARINAQGMADRAAIRAQTSREIAGIQAQTYANTQATNDRMHRRTMEGIGEYNTYRNTDGGTVRSSIHEGQRVLRLQDGTVVNTNSPYFGPAGSQELQRVR